MGELTDFLVWLSRQHKKGEIPVQTVQVVGYEVFRYLRQLEEGETPATSIEAARKHHAKHGDIGKGYCLLSECALHYPQSLHRKVSEK